MKQTSHPRRELLAVVALSALLLAGCSARGSHSESSHGDSSNDEDSSPSQEIECDRTDELSEKVCDQIDELVDDQSDVSAGAPMAVGSIYKEYGFGAPLTVGEYKFIFNSTMAEEGAPCEGDPLSDWYTVDVLSGTGIPTALEHYANSQGFESLRAADYEFCSSITHASLDGTRNPGVVEVLWTAEEGEPKPEPTCRSTEIIVTCFNIVSEYQTLNWVSTKMARTDASLEQDVATIRAFYDAYVGAAWAP